MLKCYWSISRIDQFDALISGFPAGTVTGAPKISMEIIYELEPDRRIYIQVL